MVRVAESQTVLAIRAWHRRLSDSWFAWPNPEMFMFRSRMPLERLFHSFAVGEHQSDPLWHAHENGITSMSDVNAVPNTHPRCVQNLCVELEFFDVHPHELYDRRHRCVERVPGVAQERSTRQRLRTAPVSRLVWCSHGGE